MIRHTVIGLAMSACASTGCAQVLSDPGPYPAGSRRVTVQPTQGSSFTALLYYPAMQAGENMPLDPSGAPYPAISFGHGFLQAPSRYAGILSHLASWGFFVIASESQQGFAPSHSQFALDIRECLTYLEQESARSGSFMFGALDLGNYGISGHSMGGGSGTLAAAADSRVRALATLAAAETNPSAVAASANLAIPASIISGSEDSIVPYTTNGQRMYDAMTSPKSLPLIVGGSHCGFQDVPYPLFCDSGSMPRAEQLAITRRLLTGFFLLHLSNRQDLWSDTWGPLGASDPRITTQRDPRVILNAPVEAAGLAGTELEVLTTVRNVGPMPSAIAVIPEDQPWPMTVEPAITQVLGTGEEAEVRLSMRLPPEAAGDFALLVTARREADRGARAFAELTLRVRCYADCDATTGPGVLDIFDFLCFGNKFDQRDPYACDCDLSTGPGVCDIFDFLCFGNAFSAGCP